MATTTMQGEKWTLSAIADLYDAPLLDLVFRAAEVHRRYHDPREVQLCTLLSIKTGNCPEDCAYCPQSSRYETEVDPGRMMKTDEVLAAAREAKEAGSTRFCMGAAWREVTDGRAFDRVLEIVRGVRSLGMEACCTLGMLTEDQARRLAEAGLSAYNHNLDTSEDYYGQIITTRTYEDRLRTIANVANAGISVCCGGILGMGESQLDRIKLLHTLANLDPQPESVPINALVPVERHAARRASRRSTPSTGSGRSRSRASCCRTPWCGSAPAACRSRARRRPWLSSPAPIPSSPARSC